MVITQIGRKKLGGQRACLGDIGCLLLIFRGEPRANFTKVGLNRTNLNLSDCQFNCIIFVKEH